MEDYKPNSHKSKEQQEEPATNDDKKIITTSVKVRRKKDIRNIVNAFISEDISNVKSDVLVPAIKKAISDIVTNGIEMIFYGENGRQKNNTTGPKISYRNYYDKSNDRSSTNKSRNTYRYDDIIFDNRGEAEEVLWQMDEIISTYGLASVADLYELVDISSNYTDNKYGWTDIRNGSVTRVKDGYMLKLPKALPLN